MKKTLLLLAGVFLGSLAACFLHAQSGGPSAGNPAARREPPAPQATAQRAPAPAPAPGRRPWEAIESTNYAIYVSNLRAVGCPEDTIATIINADLRQNLASGKPLDSHPDARSLFQREKEIKRILDELGIGYVAEPGDPLFGSDQLRRVREALSKYPVLPPTDPHAAENASKRRELIGQMTPEQEIYLKSEFERYGSTVTYVLAGFLPTQQEYYAMIVAMGSNSRDELAGKLKDVLSPQRYAQFMEARTPEHLAVFDFAYSHPEEEGKMEQLKQILARKSTLSLQEYRDQLRSILHRNAFEDFIRSNPY